MAEAGFYCSVVESGGSGKLPCPEPFYWLWAVFCVFVTVAYGLPRQVCHDRAFYRVDGSCLLNERERTRQESRACKLQDPEESVFSFGFAGV